MSNMFLLISHVILFYPEITSNYNAKMQLTVSHACTRRGSRVTAITCSVADVVRSLDLNHTVLAVPVDLVVLGLDGGVLGVVETSALHAVDAAASVTSQEIVFPVVGAENVENRPFADPTLL